MNKLNTLLEHIADAAENGVLVKITLGNKRQKAGDLKNVYVKPVMIKEAMMLSFVYRHTSNDITKNFTIKEAAKVLEEILQKDFFNADVYTTTQTLYYAADANGKEKLVAKAAEIKAAPVLTHDRQKNRLLHEGSSYLNELGITTADGKVKKEMQHKYRQINRYVEIIESILKEAPLQKGFSVADMGSGKGYLTFALYDHLQKKHIDAQVSGIEIREELVNKCNGIANRSGFTGLHFKKGSIQETPLQDIDMLIALHACDTATDDAIFKGIESGAQLIICAPCCHKQIRKQMAPDNALKHITKHGILLERQAEMVTDTIRSLILEANGYKTKVFEFIEEEDTPKNVLIVGTKHAVSPEVKKENLDKVNALKDLFGIKEHYLETLFG